MIFLQTVSWLFYQAINGDTAAIGLLVCFVVAALFFVLGIKLIFDGLGFMLEDQGDNSASE